MVPDLSSAKGAGLEGEGTLGAAASTFKKCTSLEARNYSNEMLGERQPSDMNLKEPSIFWFVFNLRVPEYALEAALEIKEDTVFTTLKAMGQ